MKNKNLFLIMGIFLIVFSFGIIISSSEEEQEEKNLLKNDINDETINDIDKEMPKDSAVLIEKKIDDLTGWTKAKGEGWVTGNGILGDPYKIEDLTFSGDNDNNSLIIQNSDYYFEINNCTFINAGNLVYQAGLILQDTHNGTIIGNNFSTGINTKGIRLDDCNNNTFKNNLIHDCSVGIEMMGSSLENKIINNTISDISSEAIYIYDYSHDTTIENNTITNCGSIGIEILRSKCMVVNNTISDLSYAGIIINNIASGLTQLINNTIINSNDGIRLSSTNDITIRGNIIEDCDSHGIIIHFTPNTIVSGNKLSNCGIGNSETNSRIELRTTTIYPNNTVNGKPVYFYKDEIGLGADNFTNAGQVILYNCSYSEISNLNTSHSSVGIALHYCENNTISGNMVRGNGVHGIVLYMDSINNTVYNNTIINIENCGIYLDTDCEENVIDYNIITGCDEGIRIYYSSNNNFTSNTIKNGHINGYGIRLRESEENLIWNNTIIDNYRAIYFWDNCHNNTISFNNITDTAAGTNQRYGIHLNNDCDDNTISENNITALSDWGIFFQDGCDDNEISYNNILDNNLYGIYFDMGGGNNNMIKFNNVSNNGKSTSIRAGILFLGMVYNNTIYGNILNYNGYTGIRIWQYCIDIKILNNTINYNGRDGIYLSSGCDFNIIKNNTIIDNGQYGIHFNDGTSDCNDNEIINNTICDNGIAGIYFFGKCTYNKILNNTIKWTGSGGSQNYGIYLLSSGDNHPDNNLIMNNTIMDHVDYGIWLDTDCDNNDIAYNTIVENNGIGGSQKRGIYLSTDCGNNTIYKNEIHDHASSGIRLYNADDNKIFSNIVMGNNDGIYVDNSHESIIKNNTVQNNGGTGIYIWDNCNYTLIWNNTVQNNGADGIALDTECCHNRIWNNTVNSSDNYGIYLWGDCHYNRIWNNTVIDNDQEGIHIDGDYNLILDNIVKDTPASYQCDNGIYILGGSYYNNVSGNMVYGITATDESGILITSNAKYNNISDNIVFNNYYGITLYGGGFETHNNTIHNNTVIDNIECNIRLYDNADWNYITENTCNNSKYGIYIADDSDHNFIIGNIIGNNTVIGVYLDASGATCANNYFYKNLFLNNTLHAKDDENAAVNYWYWYDPVNPIGNFWDNYTGSDPNDDGIGNIPYNISGDGNRQDLYPICWDGQDVFPGGPAPPAAGGDDDDDDDDEGIIPGYDIAILITIIALFSCLIILNRRKLLHRFK